MIGNAGLNNVHRLFLLLNGDFEAEESEIIHLESNNRDTNQLPVYMMTQLNIQRKIHFQK